MADPFEIATWALMALSVFGTFFVTRKRISGMYIWTVANAGWIAVFLLKGLPAASAMYVVYFGLAVYGIYAWNKESMP